MHSPDRQKQFIQNMPRLIIEKLASEQS